MWRRFARILIAGLKDLLVGGCWGRDSSSEWALSWGEGGLSGGGVRKGACSLEEEGWVSCAAC